MDASAENSPPIIAYGPPPPPPRHELRLTTALQKVLGEVTLEEGEVSARPLTLGLIIEITGERAFGVLMAFLCLPFIQPIPLPGLSIPFGVALMILGAQIAVRKHRPWLPARMLALKLPQKFGTKLLSFLTKLFRPLEKVVRPRLLIMQNPIAMVFVGIALFFDGFLLVFLPALPGSNLIPAWIALITILGITEEDGVALLGGTLLSMIAAITAVVLIVMGWHEVTAWWHHHFGLA